MKLKHPESDADFDVSPAYFITVFDVYDREETLEVELEKFDPNVSQQRTALLRKYCFEGPRVAKLSAEHKSELIRVLKLALDENFDFVKLFETDYDAADYLILPKRWN